MGIVRPIHKNRLAETGGNVRRSRAARLNHGWRHSLTFAEGVDVVHSL